MIIALVAFTTPAFGQGKCFPTEILQHRLATEFNEHPTAAGVALNSGGAALFELYVCEANCPSAEIEGDSTFTLVIEMAKEKQTCVVGAGTNWQQLDAPVPAKGDAT